MVTKHSDEEFKGLYTYLDGDTCDGPQVMQCKISKSLASEEDLATYFKSVDSCLFNNRCLSYHSILIYKQKINESNYEGRQALTDTSGRLLAADSLDDLQLSEVNYICMKEAIDEETKDSRLNIY